MSTREVAEYLHVHQATVRYWARWGRLRAFRIGNRLRFRKKDVEAALAPERVLTLFRGRQQPLSASTVREIVDSHLPPKHPLARRRNWD